MKKLMSEQKEQALALARRIGNDFVSRTITGSDKNGNNYEVELTCEALLLLEMHADWVAAYLTAEKMMDPREAKSWVFQLFHDAAYPWFESTHQLDEFKEAYVAVAERWKNEAVRRESGTIVFHGPQVLRGSLIDMLQAYMLRMCRAAALTGREKLAIEAVDQYRRYRTELRNSCSGCFHQGRGWLENDVLSPSPWSRGQGWVVHGLIHCLPLLERWPALHEELEGYYLEFINDLINWQQPSGFWHQLIDRPDESFPDTSGTALIFEGIQLGINRGILDDLRHVQACDKAWTAISAQVDGRGRVDQACAGPGTIWEVEPWLNKRAPKGEPHGIFSMLFACAARAGYLAGGTVIIPQ